jgi:hypothetical protein
MAREIEPAPVPLKPLGVSQVAFSERDQLRVPAPVLLIMSVCGLGLLPPCTLVKEKLVALRPMVGVGAAAAVVVVGVSIWLSPGMESESFCMPRPVDELPPVLDELGAANPDRDEKLDDVDVVGLDRLPASDSDVVVVVVLELDVFAGAVLVVVELTAVESLL